MNRHPRPKPDAPPGGRRGFTLIELLIVIIIIGVLIGLLLPAIGSVRASAQNARVRIEISNLGNAIAAFKARFGIEPPSKITLYEAATGWANDDTGSRAIIRRLWPQFNFSIDRDLGVTDKLELDASEAIVFFLGGNFDVDGVPRGFSKNPANPLVISDNRDGPFFEFDVGRLQATDDFFAYRDSLPTQTQPYLYFSSYDGRGYRSPELNAFGLSGITDFYFQKGGAVKHKPNSYQIISPGRDGLYGAGGEYDPENPDTLTVDDLDNITNFSSGVLASP